MVDVESLHGRAGKLLAFKFAPRTLPASFVVLLALSVRALEFHSKKARSTLDGRRSGFAFNRFYCRRPETEWEREGGGVSAHKIWQLLGQPENVDHMLTEEPCGCPASISLPFNINGNREM